jgi:protein tyrosine phosphatase (PTP) superfamily phosphohydrolase (DUF442 family)
MLSRRSVFLASIVCWVALSGLPGCRAKSAAPDATQPKAAAPQAAPSPSLAPPTAAQEPPDSPAPAAATGTLVAATLGSTPNVHAHDTTLLCGQPTQEDLALAKEQGFQIVLTLRGQDEIDWDEQGVAEQLGLQFRRVEMQDPATLSDDVFAQTREILRSAKANGQKVMVHCGSANRVGAVWLVHRVLDEGVSLDQAEQEAREVGLRSEALLQRATQYIKQETE